MPKISQDLQKHTVNLFTGDFDRLGVLFPEADKSDVLRRVLREFIAKCEANNAKELPKVEVAL